MEITTKIKWDNDNNPSDTGWVFLDTGNNWQAVPGKIGRDEKATREEIEKELVYYGMI